MSSYFDVIKRPIVSEKSTRAAEQGAVYTLEVLPGSNKQQIKEAVERAFGVEVLSLRTMLVHGKIKRSARGGLRKCSGWKKAVVTLKQGHKIEFFQGV